MQHVVWYPGYERQLVDVVRAENCDLHTADGRRYVDLESGVWCATIGHGHPRVRAALIEQVSRVAHTGFVYTCDVVETAAREVLGALDFGDGHAAFLCSGSEAVEFGVRVTQALAPGQLLLTMADSYFGAYGSASRKRDDEWYCHDWQACPDGCAPGCAHWDAIPWERIGGLVFEPGSSSGLVRFPPAPLVAAMAREVRARGGLIMVNEVTTGLGRTGAWFGFQHYDLVPDVVALGKSVGNGYPVSVVAFAAGVLDRLDSPLRYAQSHQNDPLGAAVALAVLQTMREERLVERGREVAQVLHTGLQAIAAGSRRVRAVRARGLMLAVELADDGNRVQRDLLARGFVVARRPGLDVLRLDPALTIPLVDVEAFLVALADVLAAPAP